MDPSRRLDRVLLDLRREYLRSLDAPAEDPPGLEGLLRVRAGGREALLRLGDLREIVRVPEQVPLPGRSGTALAPVRGRLVAVADLGVVLFGLASQHEHTARLCTLRVDDHVGVVVEEALDVVQVPSGEVARASALGGAACLRGEVGGAGPLVDGVRLAQAVFEVTG